MSKKRKDNKGRLLRTGESQTIYASDLQELRKKEKEIQKQVDDGLDYEAGQIK